MKKVAAKPSKKMMNGGKLSTPKKTSTPKKMMNGGKASTMKKTAPKKMQQGGAIKWKDIPYLENANEKIDSLLKSKNRKFTSEEGYNLINSYEGGTKLPKDAVKKVMENTDWSELEKWIKSRERLDNFIPKSAPVKKAGMKKKG